MTFAHSNISTEFTAVSNPTRSGAISHFNSVLHNLRSTDAVTESLFAAQFLEHVASDGSLYLNGWYDPPPSGVAVLFANASNPQRISFHSLRQPEWWPGSNIADWSDLLMYFYASPCPAAGGPIGDFAVTLYLGTSPPLLSYYGRCLAATEEVLRAATDCTSSRVLFEKSNEIYGRHGLQNVVVSYTDTTPLDLGHTFPSVAPLQGGENERAIGSVEKDRIRQARHFINGSADWQFVDGIEFSVEPQLRDINDPALPQITFHFRLVCERGRLAVDPDIHKLISTWMTLPR